MIQILQGPALHRQGGEVGRQGLGPGDGAVEQHHPAAPLGLQVLEQQPGHPAGPHHRHLLLVEGHQLILTAGLPHLELGQLHRRGADRHRAGAEVGLGAYPLAGAHRLIEQPVEDRPDGTVFLTQPHHLLDLGEDLALSEHQAVEAGGHPQQMAHRLLVVVGEQVGAQLLHRQTGMVAEEVPDGTDALVGMAQEGVDLQPVAGAQDRSLDHLLIRPQPLEGILHGLLGDAQTLADFHRSRAMAETDDGDVHGGGREGPDAGGFSEGRCSWLPP